MQRRGCNMKAVAATSRTIKAIQAADRMLVNVPGGKFHKGAFPSFGGETGGDFSYPGPFKISKATDTSVLLEGENLGQSRTFKNYVILGRTTLTVNEQTYSGITASGYLCLRIQFVSNNFSLSLQYFTSSMPQQADTIVYVPLAYIKCLSGKIDSIMQLQYGMVTLYSRFL
ncbi:MAG: hypothetical protein SNJ71_00810 [Bacteroidales bacterium]